MSYAEAVERLYARGHELTVRADAPRRKFDLEQMRVLTAALGHPERQFRSVLIAGTNGKGSTAATLASILQAAGHCVGLYTSPHLSRVNERIQIQGVPISDDDFARLYFRVDETGERLVRDGRLPQAPSFFETMTAVAFLYFAEHAAGRSVELAVLEVGMGGRLDATNIVEPLLSILTDISLDHMEWLGPTIASIAREKAGILRPNGVLITLPQHPEANQTIGEVAVGLGVTGVSAVEYMPPQDAPFWGAAYSVAALGGTVELAPKLAGTHQHRNVALAVAAAVELCNRYGYKLTPQAISAGVRATRWPGRLELFPREASRPAVLLDVAHNPAGAWTLRSGLNHYNPADDDGSSRTLLFGCLRDKAIQEMAQILFPLFGQVVLTPVHSPRAAAPGELMDAAQMVGVPATAVESSAEGLALALERTAQDNLLVCTGSVYLVGAVRQALQHSAGEADSCR